MEFNTDPTLTNILNQCKEIKKNIELFINNSNNRILDINKMSAQLTALSETELSITNQTILRQYKSSIFEMKSEIENQIAEIGNYLKKINLIISVVERAIRLNIGDIF